MHPMWERKRRKDMNYMNYIKRVTPEQIRESAIKNQIDWFPIHDCAICGKIVGYRFFRWPNYEVVFDSTCDCSYYENLRPRSWEDVANHINMQSNEEYAKECMKYLKLI